MKSKRPAMSTLQAKRNQVAAMSDGLEAAEPVKIGQPETKSDATPENRIMHDSNAVNLSGETPKTAAATCRKERIKIVFKRKAPEKGYATKLKIGQKKQSIVCSEQSTKKVNAAELSAITRTTRTREKQVPEPCLQLDTATCMVRQDNPVIKKSRLASECSSFNVGMGSNTKEISRKNIQVTFPLAATAGTADSNAPFSHQGQSHVSSAESSDDMYSNAIDQRSAPSEGTLSVQTKVQYSSSSHSTSAMMEVTSSVNVRQKQESKADLLYMERVTRNLHGYASHDAKDEMESLHADGDTRVSESFDHGHGKLEVDHNPGTRTNLVQFVPAGSTGPSGRLKHVVRTSLVKATSELALHDPKYSKKSINAAAIENNNKELITEKLHEHVEDEEDTSNICSAEWDVWDQTVKQTYDTDADLSGKSPSQQSDDMYHGQRVFCKVLGGQRESLYSSWQWLPPEQDLNCSHASDIDSELGIDSSHQPSVSEGSASPRHQISCETPGSQSHSFNEGQLSIQSDVSIDLQTLPEEQSKPRGIKLKIKMPKEVSLHQVPRTAKTLLATGLLEGYSVRYLDRAGGVMLTGIIKGAGILCDCKMCKGKTVVNVSSFEKHAGSTARHPSDNIFLDNGRSLHDIMEACWQAPKEDALEALRKALEHAGIEGEHAKHALSSLDSGLIHCNNKGNVTKAKISGSCQTKPESNFPKSTQIPRFNQTRDTSLHKLIFLPHGLPDGTELAYYIKGQRILEGIKQGSGICCSCCNQVVSCSQFEAHAGWGSRRNPYNSIYLEDGRSLHDVSLELAEHTSRSSSGIRALKDNDDYCTECGDGGDLILCDGCPKAYHTECMGLSSVPDGHWFCSHCKSETESEQSVLAKKNIRYAGKVSALRERLTGRCQRVVKVSKNSSEGCAICRNGDFLKSGFGPKTIMLCDQCEREFHVGCMSEKGLADLKELPVGKWFCSKDCDHIHHFMEAMVFKGPEPIDDNILNNFVQAQQKKNFQGQISDQKDLMWQLLHGRRGDPDNGRILSEAAMIFSESFKEIVHESSGQNFISLMLYSRTVRDQDFGGMHCAVLKCGLSVVSAAMIRVFGQQFAEMPLVATSSANRGKGYFQILLLCLERLLGMLKVQHLIVPAAEGAEGIWTDKYGFSKMPEDQVQQFISQGRMIIFEGSSMMLKDIAVHPPFTLPLS